MGAIHKGSGNESGDPLTARQFHLEHRNRMLLLYKRLCRHYFDIDPRATAFYIDAYRKMWDEESLTGGVKTDA